MQFNSHATGQDIVTYANEKARQTNGTYPLATKTTHANEALRVITELIHDAYGGWRYDDRNQTDLPTSTTNLVSGQSNYAMPTDSIGLAGVYVQNQNDSEWTKLEPLAQEEIPGAEPSFEDTDGQPRYYRMLNNSIILYPAANYSKDDALMVEYDRDVSTFATTDTTKTPGFDPTLHEAIPCYMALKFATARTLPSRVDLRREWEGEDGKGGWVGRIKGHYARKFRDLYPAGFKSRLPVNDYL